MNLGMQDNLAEQLLGGQEAEVDTADGMQSASALGAQSSDIYAPTSHDVSPDECLCASNM